MHLILYDCLNINEDDLVYQTDLPEKVNCFSSILTIHVHTNNLLLKQLNCLAIDLSDGSVCLKHKPFGSLVMLNDLCSQFQHDLRPFHEACEFGLILLP